MFAKNHRQRLFSLVLMLIFSLSPLAHAKEVNVYVQYDTSSLKTWIRSFNHFLATKGVFTRYGIRPLIEDHPLHTTVYLTDYPEKNIEKLISAVQLISSWQRGFSVETSHLTVTDSGYVMLDLKLVKQADGQNHPLQLLSDRVVASLQHLRDPMASIPPWAQAIPIKRKAFELYGSPNVYFEYSPHFTLIATDFNSAEEGKKFQQELIMLANQFTQAKPGRFQLNAQNIALGYVDKHGQISHQIASYNIPTA